MPSDCTPTGRAATRTPEPPDRDEHENSPPPLSRPKRAIKPPDNYAREQEKEIEQRNKRSQQKRKHQDRPATQCGATIAGDCATENEDLGIAKLIEVIVELKREIRLRDDFHKEELIELREEIRRRDDLHREELEKLKEELSATLYWLMTAKRMNSPKRFDVGIKHGQMRSKHFERSSRLRMTTTAISKRSSQF